mmetsp:Transcript_35249/g.99763  ORF Transcript_35249/g.99763 Transcript_35249/m.99763 type:complete len:260 (+) Transcript_35249:1164-1943(+)
MQLLLHVRHLPGTGGGRPRRAVQRLDDVLRLELQQPLPQHLHLLERLQVHNDPVAGRLAGHLGHLLHLFQLSHLLAELVQLLTLVLAQARELRAVLVADVAVPLELHHELGLLPRDGRSSHRLQVALHDGVQLEEVSVDAVEAVVVGVGVLSDLHHAVGKAARGDGLVNLAVAAPDVGNQQRFAVAAERVFEKVCELGGAVRDVADVSLGQRHNHLLEKGEGLVDVEGLAGRGPRDARLICPLAAREVHKVELRGQFFP